MSVLGCPGAVLVTGGAGYIGSHVALALIEAGYQVAAIDDLSTGHVDLVPEECTFFRGDVGDRDLVSYIIESLNITGIIHLAASLKVDESCRNPLAYYENNVAKSCQLFKAAADGGVRQIVFSSTAAVYGETQEDRIGEHTYLCPINPYGHSKWMVEELLARSATVEGFNYCVLRYFNVAGADPSLRSGQCSNNATHLIKVACQAALGQRDTIKIFGTDYATADGTGVRDYVHVSDLADAHVCALKRLNAQSDENLVLNCGYGHGYSVKEVLDSVSRVSGKKINVVCEGRRSGDAGLLVADNRRILDTLLWRPKYNDLDAIIEHALQWEQTLSHWDTVQGVSSPTTFLEPILAGTARSAA